MKSRPTIPWGVIVALLIGAALGVVFVMIVLPLPR
jgi:F0F1-type ATP synthase assembly protein I